MLKTWTGVFAVLLSLAACAPIPVVDPQSVRVEGTPGMSVIYLVRSMPDHSPAGASVYLDDRWIGATRLGTFFRLEVPAGRHRFTGDAIDQGTITLDTQADHVYFVEMRVFGIGRDFPYSNSQYTIIPEARARAVMARADRMQPVPCAGPLCSRGTVTVLPLIPQPQ